MCLGDAQQRFFRGWQHINGVEFGGHQCPRPETKPARSPISRQHGLPEVGRALQVVCKSLQVSTNMLVRMSLSRVPCMTTMLSVAFGKGSVCRSLCRGRQAMLPYCGRSAEKEDKCTLYSGSRSWLQDFLSS